MKTEICGFLTVVVVVVVVAEVAVAPAVAAGHGLGGREGKGESQEEKEQKEPHLQEAPNCCWTSLSVMVLAILITSNCYGFSLSLDCYVDDLWLHYIMISGKYVARLCSIWGEFLFTKSETNVEVAIDNDGPWCNGGTF